MQKFSKDSEKKEKEIWLKPSKSEDLKKIREKIRKSDKFLGKKTIISYLISKLLFNQLKSENLKKIRKDPEKIQKKSKKN